MTEYNPGGRPRVNSSKRKKHQLVCYVDDVEFMLVKKRISTTHEKKAELLKNALFKELKSGYREPRKYTQTEIDFLNEISRLGNVLNQIAAKLNAGIELRGIDSVDLLSSIDELNKSMIVITEKI